MTPIFYEDASALLGISVDTLKQAIGRGVLTRLPREGRRQRLIKEQVALFRGKQLSLNSLSPDERARWNKLNTMANPPAQPTLAASFVSVAPPVLDYKQLAREMLEASLETGSPVTFQPAPLDQVDSRKDDKQEDKQDSRKDDKQSSGDTMLFFLAILAGLALLFLFSKNQKAKERASRTVEQMGLSPNEAPVNTETAVQVLRNHPNEVRELKSILVSENLFDDAA